VHRKFRMTSVSRALTIVVALACVALALTPPLPQARGASGTSLAVIAPENSAHVSASVLDQIAQATYEGAVGSGRYEVKGHGPIRVEASSTGDILPAALGAASRVDAQQVLVTDVVSVTEGKLLYRMSIYQVNPVAVGRSQVFSETFPPSDQRALASELASGIATLDAPRTYTGTIFSLTPSITADTGSQDGFALGQRFNVVRGGQKVAEAQIVQIGDNSATVDILNPNPGYQAQVGDRLISQTQGPAIANPSSHSNNGVLNVLGVFVGVGAALLALGTTHKATPVQCPPPTPTGAACTTIPPSGAGTFTVAETSTTGTPTQPTLTFTFSKPVLGAATFPFGGTTQLYITSQVGIAGMPSPPQPIAGFGGATGIFDPSNTVMTITVTGTLTAGYVYFIVFTNQITATDGTPLTGVPFRYPATGTCCAFAVRPAQSTNHGSGSHGTSPNGNGASANGTNGNGSNGNGHQAPPPKPAPNGHSGF